MWNWLHEFFPLRKEKVQARWLPPGKNPWGLVILDCTQIALTMVSYTRSSEIAEKYAMLRSATGEELRSKVFNTIQSVNCSLAYNGAARRSDGPIFKAQSMEEKWDIYLYDDYFYFCRSWTGDLFYRATVKWEPPMLRVLVIDTTHQESDEKAAIRDVDFLIKSHVLLANALHPLPRDIGKNTEKLALCSSQAYGRMALYGTFEETIGTPYFWNQPLPNRP